MFNISDFLKKFAHLGQDIERAVVVFRKTTLDLGLNLDGYQITYKEGVFTVACPHTVKNMLFIKKAELMEALRAAGIKAENVR